MYTFILVLQAIIAAGLIGVILMQKSEGGGLGVGGSPAGFLSARGAADFLTRATAILATAFVGLSVLLAVLASVGHRANQIDVDAASKLNLPPAGAPAVPAQTVPAPAVPSTGVPLATDASPLAVPPATQAPADAAGGVPLQQ